MAETTCRMLLLSFPVLFLLLSNVGTVAGDGFLDEINTESLSSLFSSGNLDDAKKAMSAASPDVKGAVAQFAGGDSAASSPELAQAYKDAEEEKDGASWKSWLKGKMSGMGYGSPAGAPAGAPAGSPFGAPAGSPEGVPVSAMGSSSSISLSPSAEDHEAPAPAPSA
ncbi:unnamed protein product [Linum trigynum]